jgi:NAD(P)-dependent dehydrogenase (short-subunit alcohol dehydrogenase family)
LGPITEFVAREKNMDLKLEGKIALVTGASRGLGAATARLLAAEGARLALSARNADTLEATAADIRTASGAEVATVAQDLTEPGATDKVAAAALDAYGRIDILINSAGAARGGGFWDSPDEVWEQSLALKFFATMRMIRAVLPTMRTQKYGRIVTIVGNGGNQPGPRALPGASANAALLALTSGLAREIAPDGIFINAVNPGPTMTDRWTTLMADRSRQTGQSVEALQAEIEENIPLGRFGDPDEIARAVAFLASDCASNITGTSILCDGGEVMAPA